MGVRATFSNTLLFHLASVLLLHLTLPLPPSSYCYISLLLFCFTCAVSFYLFYFLCVVLPLPVLFQHTRGVSSYLCYIFLCFSAFPHAVPSCHCCSTSLMLFHLNIHFLHIYIPFPFCFPLSSFLYIALYSSYFFGIFMERERKGQIERQKDGQASKSIDFP